MILRAQTVEAAQRCAIEIGFPLVIQPNFSPDGGAVWIARDLEDFNQIIGPCFTRSVTFEVTLWKAEPEAKETFGRTILELSAAAAKAQEAKEEIFKVVGGPFTIRPEGRIITHEVMIDGLPCSPFEQQIFTAAYVASARDLGLHKEWIPGNPGHDLPAVYEAANLVRWFRHRIPVKTE